MTENKPTYILPEKKPDILNRPGGNEAWTILFDFRTRNEFLNIRNIYNTTNINHPDIMERIYIIDKRRSVFEEIMDAIIEGLLNYGKDGAK
jgi:hypothetical protein